MSTRLSVLACSARLRWSACAGCSNAATSPLRQPLRLRLQPRPLSWADAATEEVQFTVSLRLPGAADLDRYLHGLVDARLGQLPDST